MLPFSGRVTGRELFVRPEQVMPGHVGGVARGRHSAPQGLAQRAGVVTGIAAAQTHELDSELLAASAELLDVRATAQGGVNVFAKQALS